MATTVPPPFCVKDKTAIITGAGSGINFSFAQLLLSKGCNVVIADLGLRPEAQKLIDDYDGKDDKKPRAIFVKTDVVQWPDLDNMFDATEKEFGGFDIVCPGAGIFEPHWSNFWHPPSTSVSKDSASPPGGIGHYATLDINITHPIRCTQLAISRWLNPRPTTKSKPASPESPKRIVHISSVAGQTPGFTTPLYIASKHAISGFIRSMYALEPTLGIRVNGVAPGVIKTPLWTEHPEKMKMVRESDEWVEPEEVAEAMVRCCEEAGWDGGKVVEVVKGRTRSVDWRNDPGPMGAGASASGREEMSAEVFGWLGKEGWGVPKK